jgi:type II secretory pathway pseudopilin PulG
MKKALQPSATGYSLVEICVALVVLMLVGGLAYSMLINSTTLFAKNVSLNSSNSTLRGALDRMYSEINQANGLPKLINADGSDAASPSGPAAGIIFDRYLGGPYIVTNPSGSGLPATAQSFEMTRSTNALASPPIPAVNDVICMDNGTTRPRVSSCTVSGGGIQTLSVTLQAPLGSAISWSATVNETAYLVHRKAFVVVPVNGRGELRIYNDAETVTNYDDPAGYVVLTRDIGTQTQGGEEEHKPFRIISKNGTQFLKVAMRVEDRQFNQVLSTRQAREFNTFLRVDTELRPRNFLQ